MAKQTKSLTHFSELTSSELHRISGGDWWENLGNVFFPRRDKINSNDKHKLG